MRLISTNHNFKKEEMLKVSKKNLLEWMNHESLNLQIAALIAINALLQNFSAVKNCKLLLYPVYLEGFEDFTKVSWLK